MHLSEVVDRFITEYIAAIEKIEDKLACREFTPLKSDLTKYKLIKIQKNLWELLLKFTREHDNYHGNSRWHIFDSSGRNMIKVYNNESTTQYNSGFHCVIHSLVEDSEEGMESTDEVWLVWWDVQNNKEYSIRNYWTVEQTFYWLIDEIIPLVMYLKDSNTFINKLGLKKSVSFDEYKKLNTLSNRYFRIDDRYFDMNNIKKVDDLIKLIRSLQLYYSTTREVYIEKNSIENVYDSLIYILNISYDTDFYYICSKLEINQTSNIEKLKTQINKKKEFEKYGKINGGCLDMILRSITAAIEYSKEIINPDEIKLITQYLKPITKDYNLNKLVNAYNTKV